MTQVVLIVEQLAQERWGEYKELKLDSLKEDPLAFSPGIEHYKNYSNKNWQDELKQLSTYPQRLIFAEINGDLVGMSGSRIYSQERFKHNASVQGLFVKQAYRGNGIAQVLTERSIKLISQDSSIKNIVCEIYSSQIASITLHQKLGFEIVGTLKNFVYDGSAYYDAYQLQKCILRNQN